MKDIRFEYDIYDASHVVFEKKFSESGDFILQHLNVDRKGGLKYDYRLYRPDTPLDGDEILYHVSSVKHHKEIMKNGLKAGAGYTYVNHWMAFAHNNKDVENNLHKGVFFTRHKPLEYQRGKFFCVSVRVGDLNPDMILIDDAFRDNSSVFYCGDVAPELLKLET